MATCSSRTVLLPKFSSNGKHGTSGELLVIASDGELYGHHQPFRDKFLQYLTQWGGLHQQIVDFVYPGRWILEQPPQKTLKIRENTSWSCHHGISRWMEPCPCSPHGDWKTQLRKAINQIAAAVDEPYVDALKDKIQDPWSLLYRYIDVLHGKIGIRDLLDDVFNRSLKLEEQQKIDLLLRAQLNKQRMFTSCGWFFDDFDRLEPRFVINAAAQAVWWTKLATGIDLISKGREWLSMVHSWRSGLRGDVVFSGQIDRVRYEQLAFPFLQTERERF